MNLHHTHAMTIPARSLCLALLTLSACGDLDPLAFIGGNLHVEIVGDITFMTLATGPAAGMDALFIGELDVDENGCIRLDSPDDATVVWPTGYTLDVTSGVEIVRDATGEPIGLLDGEFSLGGGEVTHLHLGIGFSEAEESFAVRQCPGRYWIVNGG